jgi:hypothetical protein
VAVFQAEVLDAGAGGLADPQPVQGEQGDQRVLEWPAEPDGGQQRAELVAVQGDGVQSTRGRRTWAAGE